MKKLGSGNIGLNGSEEALMTAMVVLMSPAGRFSVCCKLEISTRAIILPPSRFCCRKDGGNDLQKYPATLASDRGGATLDCHKIRPLKQTYAPYTTLGNE